MSPKAMLSKDARRARAAAAAAASGIARAASADVDRLSAGRKSSSAATSTPPASATSVSTPTTDSKSGSQQARKKRELQRWTSETDQRLLLCFEYVLCKLDVRAYDAVADNFDSRTTGNAIKQHLQKVRKKLQPNVPPPLRRLTASSANAMSPTQARARVTAFSSSTPMSPLSPGGASAQGATSMEEYRSTPEMNPALSHGGDVHGSRRSSSMAASYVAASATGKQEDDDDDDDNDESGYEDKPVYVDNVDEDSDYTPGPAPRHSAAAARHQRGAYNEAAAAHYRDAALVKQEGLGAGPMPQHGYAASTMRATEQNPATSHAAQRAATEPTTANAAATPAPPRSVLVFRLPPSELQRAVTLGEIAADIAKKARRAQANATTTTTSREASPPAASGTTAQKRKRPASGARNATRTIISIDDDDDSGPDEAVLNSRRVGRLVGEVDVSEARNNVAREQEARQRDQHVVGATATETLNVTSRSQPPPMALWSTQLSGAAPVKLPADQPELSARTSATMGVPSSIVKSEQLTEDNTTAVVRVMAKSEIPPSDEFIKEMVKYEMKLEDDELRRREEMELKQQKQQRDWGLRPWGGLQCTGITKSTTSAAAAPQLPNGGPSSALDDVGPHAARTSGPLGNNHRSLHSEMLTTSTSDFDEGSPAMRGIVFQTAAETAASMALLRHAPASSLASSLTFPHDNNRVGDNVAAVAGSAFQAAQAPAWQSTLDLPITAMFTEPEAADDGTFDGLGNLLIDWPVY